MRLFLCEKPSQGHDLARVLGATQRGDGCYSGAGVTVTWCIGHLVEAVAPEAYDPKFKSWSIQDLPIVPVHWRVEVKASTAAQFKAVQRLIAHASELVIATDADREGEMIAREILDLCAYHGPLKRLWLHALNDASIRQALSELRPGADTLPLYHAALARSRGDWLVGLNLTRLFTVLGRQAGYDGVLSVGRVQTPTLALVVARDRAITTFVAVPYWVVEALLSTGRATFAAHWIPSDAVADSSGRCIQLTAAQAAAETLRRAGRVSVSAVDTEHVSEPPPLPFELSKLQEVCSRQFGLDVQETLDIAQSLYERHKATTYPRTDCAYLPVSMLAEVPTVLNALLTADSSLSSLMPTLDTSLRSRAWNDAKVEAHHGIIPTLEPPRLAALSAKELQVYRLIRAHYLAQFLPHHEIDRTTMRLRCADVELQARGKRETARGWRSVFDTLHLDDDVSEELAQDQTLPQLSAGSSIDVAGVEIKSLKTSPPKPYTQGELIKDMRNVAKFVSDPRHKQTLKETAGIGTVATQAGHVQGLIDRRYLLKQGRSLRASPTGFTLIDAVPRAVADPVMSAIWEQALERVAAGRMTVDDFVGRQSAWVSQIVRDHAHSQLSFVLPDSPACPVCGAKTRQRRSQHGPFWSCTRYPECKGTLAMKEDPSRGSSAPSTMKRSGRKPRRPRSRT